MILTKPGQSVQISITEPPVVLHEVLSANLHESINEHPTLTAQVRFKGGLPAGLKIAGARVKMAIAEGIKFVPVFDGRADDVDVSADEASIVAVGASGERDLAVCTRSFGGDPEPKPIHKLAGIADLLKGVTGGPKLTLPVAQVYQYAQTDFAKLVELAQMHQLFVAASGTGALALSDGRDGPKRDILPALIVPGSERVHVRRRTAAVDCLTWNPQTGETPSRAVTGKADTNGSGLFADIARHLTVSALLRHQVFPAASGAAISDRARADCLTQAQLGRLVRWHGQLLHPAASVGINHRLALKRHPLTEELLVVARNLSYEPSAAPAARQLINSVECTPVGMIPFAGPAGLSGPAIPLLGQVCDVKDPQQFARVKVTFPWHRRAGNRQTWEGLWSQTCQRFGGAAGPGKAHGSIELPKPLDWVLALVDPSGFEPPIVLTTIYRGPKGSAPRVSDPELERVLLWTQAGLRVIADDGSGGKPASISLAIVAPDGKDLVRFVISADGSVKLTGKKLNLEGVAKLKGSLDVVKP